MDMKICPQCQRTFTGDLNFCLEDGVPLVAKDFESSVQTLSGSNSSNQNITNENRFSPTQETARFGSKPQRSNPSLLPKILFLGGILVLFLGISLVAGTLIIRQILKNSPQEEAINTPSKPSPQTSPTSVPEQELKVEILDKVNGSFGDRFIKLKITNPSGQIIKIDSRFISLSFYKDDVKLDDNSAPLKLRYLKPNQSIPIWVRMYKVKNYTSVKLKDPLKGKPVKRSEEAIYSTLKFTEMKMTSKMGILTYNGRPLRKRFYKVSGIVQSNIEANNQTQVFVLFYDKNSKIIGIYDRSMTRLTKGEKNKFEVQIGEYDLFGKPENFKVIAIKDTWP